MNRMCSFSKVLQYNLSMNLQTGLKHLKLAYKKHFKLNSLNNRR